MSKKKKARLLLFLIFSVTIAAVVLITVSLISYLVLISSPDKVKGKYDVIYRDWILEDGDDCRTVRLSSEKIYKNGCWYINFDDVAEFYGFSVSGDSSALRYFLRNEFDDQLIVDFDKGTLELNGISVNTEAPFKDSDGATYLPMLVIERYFDGISFMIDEENKAFIVEFADDINLTVRDPDTTGGINKTDIPTDEIERTPI